jgi:hypothetical protein
MKAARKEVVPQSTAIKGRLNERFLEKLEFNVFSIMMRLSTQKDGQKSRE